MKIREVRNLLARLKNIQSEMGAKGQTKDLDCIDELLDGHEDKDIDKFVENTKLELSAKPARKTTAAAKLNSEIIQHFVARLIVENRPNGNFELVFDDLINSKDIHKPEAIAIARKFLDSKLSFKTKTAAFDKIHARYIQDRLYESKRELIN